MEVCGKFSTILADNETDEVFLLSLTNDQIRLMDWLARRDMLAKDIEWKGKVTETAEI